MAARYFVNGHDRPTATDDVVRNIVHIICKQPGCELALSELKRKIRQQRLELHRNISTLLEDYSDNFRVTDSMVSANTDIEICPEHCSKKNCVDSSCDKLHICKFFLISTCTFGTNSGVACEFGHDLDSTHNKQLLSEHLLDKLNVQEFQRLFQKGTHRSAITLPMICRYYNNMRGCTRSNTCPHIHICQYYVQGSCKFGTACKRNHDVTPRIKGILVKYGIDTSRRIRDILHDLRVNLPITNPTQQQTMKRYTSMPVLSQRTTAAMSIPRNRPKFGRQRNTAECEGIEKPSQERTGSLEICMYNLRRANGCWFKANCIGYHTAKKYQWQYLGRSDTDWVDFDGYMNDKLDSNYMLVECDSCTVATDGSDVDDSDSDEETSDVTVYFSNMEGVGKGRQLLVRRLSTSSSATLNPRVARSFHAYVTRWCWFWYNDNQKEWIEYGLPVGYSE